MILELPLSYAMQIVFTLFYCASKLYTSSAAILLLLAHRQSLEEWSLLAEEWQDRHSKAGQGR